MLRGKRWRVRMKWAELALEVGVVEVNVEVVL